MKTSSRVRRAIAAPFFLSVSIAAMTAAAISAGALPAAAQPAEELSASPVADALARAKAHGTRSFVASVFENVRLTPFRSAEIVARANAIAPGLSAEIAKAAGTAEAIAARSAGAALPPGARPDADLDALTEEQRNYGYNLIGAEAAHELGLTGAGVVVGVIDSGFDQSPDGRVHPELEGRIDPRGQSYLYWVNPDLQAITAETTLEEIFGQPGDATDDTDGHGTHVAGTIAAARDGQGMVGIAPGATILPIKAIPQDGEIYVEQIDEMVPIAALQYCGPIALLSGGEDCGYISPTGNTTADAIAYLAQFDDVKVANGSFGPLSEVGQTTSGITLDDAQQAEALAEFVESGKIFVVAAGNEYIDAPVLAENPTGIGLYPFISPDNAGATNSAGAPIFVDETGLDLDFSDFHPDAIAAYEAETGAEYGRIIVVVAVDAQKEITAYSNRCGVAAEWCIAAPGGGIDRDENGNPLQRPIYSTYPTDDYGYSAGTSMAAPHVAGAVAILIEAYPHFSPGKLTDILFETAEDLGEEGVDAVYGHGLLRLDRALSGPLGIDPRSTGQYVANVEGARSWLFGFTSEGGLTKEGSGELHVAKPVEFAGETIIEDGALYVHSVFQTLRMQVGIDGTLGGGGLVVGDVDVAGTLSPGLSPGTLFVTGDVTLAGTATTRIEVDGPRAGTGAGNHDLIVLTGNGSTFTASGTLAPVLRGITGDATNSFTPSLGQTFVVAYAPEGRVTGSFDRLDQPTAGLLPGTRFDVIYTPDALSLVNTPTSYGDLSALGAAQSAAARAFGGALDEARPAAGVRPDASEASVFDPLYLVADAGALAANLDAAAGTIHVAAGQEGVRSVGRFADAVAFRQGQLALDVARTPGTTDFWSRAKRSSSDVGSGTAGHDGGATAFTFGVDHVGEAYAAGGAVSYETSEVDGAHGSADLDALHAAIYLSGQVAQFEAGLRAGLSHVEWDVRRHAFGRSFASSTDGNGGFVEAHAGQRFDTDLATLLPTVTLGYRAMERKGLSESGAFALAVDDKTYEEGHVTFGLMAERGFDLGESGRFTPRLSLAYRHDFLDIARTSPHAVLDAAFDAPGAEIGADALLATVGLEFAANDRFSAVAAYAVEARDGLTEQSLNASVVLRW
ncbi:S8 family peptidase [Lutibaculum baratangense]|nr:S8 family serine peptidase [Lutibaculum baratangense]